MKTFERYVEKYIIEDSRQMILDSEETKIIVVVPVHDESNYLQSLLDSLKKLEEPDCHCKVIFVVNDSNHDSDEVKLSNDQCVELLNKFVSPRFISVNVIELRNQESKNSGVGLARKVGMDAAALQFKHIGYDGLIVCLDADCQIAPNYLIELYAVFKSYPKALGFSIKFEHPLDGMHSKEIIDYELHLRYFIDIQKSIGLPYAIQTVGSSMAVRVSAYAAFRGMNKRQAGEDFYFLQKFIAVDGVVELNTTCVYPSDRSSSRVPFGTGKAIKDMLSASDGFKSYQIGSFKLIAQFIELVKIHCDPLSISSIEDGIDSTLIIFLDKLNWKLKLEEISKHTSSRESFLKRFYNWFNAFVLMKSLHHLRDNGYPNQEIGLVAKEYILTQYKELIAGEKEQLIYLRKQAEKLN